jgi:hypothetical protein
LGGGLIDSQPCLFADRRGDRHTNSIGLFGLRLSRVSRQDTGEWVGYLRPKRELIWFLGLYAASTALFGLFTLSIYALIHLMM